MAMTEQQKARIVWLAVKCESNRGAAKDKVYTPRMRAVARDLAESRSLEAFRIAQEARQ